MLMNGSLCIVTSRNRRVFEKSTSLDVNQEIYIHDVQQLSATDSKQVFTSYAFGGDYKVDPRFEKLVTNVSRACGGIPLVLKVCGALLKDEENEDIWEEVLEKLSCGTIMDDKIFECLRISFDALEQKHQEMFLEIACVLLGEPEGIAMRVWKSLKWSPALGIRSLKEKALVGVDSEGCFTMHDHLRDMGREIVRKRRENEGVCKHLWMPESFNVIRENKSLPSSLQTLIYSCGDVGANYRNNDLDLLHLAELRIIQCDDGMNIIALPKNLRWLYVYSTLKFNIFSMAPKDNNLVVLDIYNSDSSFESINEQVHFKHLQVLRFRRSWHRKMCLGDEILHSKDLEILDLSKCDYLYKLPEKLGSLKNLSSICLDECRALQVLPNSLGQLTKLKMLSLEGCRLPFAGGSAKSSLTTISKVKSLHTLNMKDSKIESLPESFGGLFNLEVLKLKGNNLFRLPDSFGSLRNLRDLDLRDSTIQDLPKSFGDLSKLEVLKLCYSCEKFTVLPDWFGNLRNLKHLELECPLVTSLGESFGKLSNLEVLKLMLPELVTLPNSFSSLRSLRDLDMTSCRKIQTLPESFGDLSNLQKLILRADYRQSTMLPDSFGSLHNLRALTLESSGIETLPESFGRLSNLESLDLSVNPKLNLLPEYFTSLKNLRSLNLFRTGLVYFGQSFGELSSLERLNLSQSKKIILSPDSFESLGNLHVLNLEHCSFVSVPKSFGELSNFEEQLDSEDFFKVVSLPDSFGSLRSLRELSLYHSPIELLPESFGELSSLEVLNLGRCEKLTALPKSFGGLRSLRTLDLGQSGVETLPESVGELSNLEELSLDGCSVRALPRSLTELRRLQFIDLRHCSDELSRSFESFQDLMPDSCEVKLTKCEPFGFPGFPLWDGRNFIGLDR